MGKMKEDLRPLGAPHSWARTPGTFIAAQAAIDNADHTAFTMEQKWGAGRLRFLVGIDLLEKFDRQRYLWNQAIWHGDLEAVRREAARMTAAWQALDKAASAGGAKSISPKVWEVVLADGTVAAIVKSGEEARCVIASGRKVAVYTLDEIARLLSHYPQIAQTKLTILGTTVEAVRRPSDPLDALRDSEIGLDDPLNDDLSNLGS
jgi:hypothetical protein